MVIDENDSRQFSLLSGDFNPLHLNSVDARRSMFGGTVCHGVHVVLKALEYAILARGNILKLSRLKVVFRAPIMTGQSFLVRCDKNDDSTIKINVFCGLVKTLSITSTILDTNKFSDTKLPHTSISQECSILSFDEAARAGGSIPLMLDETILKKLFPVVFSLMPKVQTAEILALSQIIGMKCPGRHSVFSQMDLTFDSGKPNSHHGLNFQVKNAREDLSSIELLVDGPDIRGNLIALYHPPPVEQASYSETQSQVRDNEFSQENALIIGGSRGLGEVTAKFIAAGGGKSILTYSVGEAEAIKVQNEITNGGGRCEIRQLTVNGKSSIPVNFPEFNQLYFFATPKIFGKRGNEFDQKRYEKLIEIYVNGFESICQSIVHQKRNLAVLYPSTTAIDEPITELREYILSKKKGEDICDILNKSNYLKIIHPRLPRIETDQTSTFTGVKSHNAVEIILPLLKEMNLYL